MNIRALGKRKYILVLAIFYGISMTIFSTIVAMLIDQEFNLIRFVSPSAMGMFTGGFLGGLIFGTSQWYRNKNKE